MSQTHQLEAFAPKTREHRLGLPDCPPQEGLWLQKPSVHSPNQAQPSWDPQNGK